MVEPLRGFDSQKPCKAVHYKPQDTLKAGVGAYQSFTHTRDRDGIRIRPRTGNEAGSRAIRGLRPQPGAPTDASISNHGDNKQAKFLDDNEYGLAEKQLPRTLSSLRQPAPVPKQKAPAATHNNFFSVGASAAAAQPISPPSAASYATSVRSSFVHK